MFGNMNWIFLLLLITTNVSLFSILRQQNKIESLISNKNISFKWSALTRFFVQIRPFAEINDRVLLYPFHLKTFGKVKFLGLYAIGSQDFEKRQISENTRNSFLNLLRSSFLLTSSFIVEVNHCPSPGPDRVNKQGSWLSIRRAI